MYDNKVCTNRFFFLCTNINYKKNLPGKNQAVIYVNKNYQNLNLLKCYTTGLMKQDS